MKRYPAYPLFIPPEHLVDKGNKQWNAQEAIEYRKWLLGVMDERIAALLERFDEPLNSEPSDHLLRIGKKIATVLVNEPYSHTSSNKKLLTNVGNAVAADMGLLIAHYLLQAFPDNLKWKTIRRPKSAWAYNMPVLVGFEITHLEPVGGSIAEANGIVKGIRDANIWKSIYEYWASKVMNPVQED